MIRPILLFVLLSAALASTVTAGEGLTTTAPTRSSWFAFVDRDYIFTLEMIKPSIALLNFVSMVDDENRLYAKHVRLMLENRKASARLFAVESSGNQPAMMIPSIVVHPRSSFGVRLEGDFGRDQAIYGVSIRMGDDDFSLAPLESGDFDILVLKVNRINLGSPDFREDWRVLHLSPLGSKISRRH